MHPKRPSLRTYILGCFGAKQSSLVEPTTVSKRTTNSKRLCVSDLSNASSLSIVSDLSNSVLGSSLHIFTLKELKEITDGFCKINFLGEGGFGRVFKGFVDDKLRPGLKPQAVAVKVLDLHGTQGHREWLAEVIFLGQLKHPNLVKLIGYCCEDEHRLLVYEYMERGNLEDKLFKGYSAALPWLTRLKIATGAANGLAFLHEEEKPVINRDIKASNILLDADFKAKLSDFGLAIDGPEEDQSHVSTRVMGTQGYAAPEYIATGHLTTMSDVYSFGVVLLELLTGKGSVDKNRPNREQNLVEWARPLLKDPRKLEKIMDPRLEGQFSIEGAQKLASLAHQCLSRHAKCRPTMRTVVRTLESLMKITDIPTGYFVYVAPNEEKNETLVQNEKKSEEEKGEKKEKGRRRHRGGQRKRGRIKPRSYRAVYSDTALYKTLGSNLYSPKEAQGREGIDENLVLV